MKQLPFFLLLLCSLFFVSTRGLHSAQQQDPTYVLRGRVLGGDTNQPLVNASIMVHQANVSSVTNQDGYFSIRVPVSTRNSRIIIRHLGYENREIPIITLIDSPNNHFALVPSVIQ